MVIKTLSGFVLPHLAAHKTLASKAANEVVAQVAAATVVVDKPADWIDANEVDSIGYTIKELMA